MKEHYKRVEKEVLALTRLSSHPNIVDYVLVEEDEKYAYIATELCDFNVKEWLREREVQDMPEEDWRKQAAGLVRGILSGLEFMHTHSPKILHKDLKPENILVVASANGERHIKIADFDTSRALERDATACTITNMGTSCWRPRMVIEYVYAKEEETSKTSIKYRASGDIQSAGMVCFYIMTKGTHPYAADDELDMVHPNVRRGRYNLSAVEDSVACDLVRLMLAHEPSVRPTAGELLRHPYFWSDETRYKFLAAIGDQQEVATFGSSVPPYNATVTAIENADVLPTLSEGQKDWGGLSVIPELGKDFQKKFSRPGYTQSVCNLLRTLRNIQAHYGQESGTAQRRLGSTLNPYAYFNAELPKLFLEMYIIIKGTAGTGDDWVQREALKTFFS